MPTLSPRSFWFKECWITVTLTSWDLPSFSPGLSAVHGTLIMTAIRMKRQMHVLPIRLGIRFSRPHSLTAADTCSRPLLPSAMSDSTATSLATIHQRRMELLRKEVEYAARAGSFSE